MWGGGLPEGIIPVVVDDANLKLMFFLTLLPSSESIITTFWQGNWYWGGWGEDFVNC